MSGLVVYPGDTLVLPVAPPSHLTAEQREALRTWAGAEFPGVKVVVAEGIAGPAFVYRPGGGR